MSKGEAAASRRRDKAELIKEISKEWQRKVTLFIDFQFPIPTAGKIRFHFRILIAGKIRPADSALMVLNIELGASR